MVKARLAMAALTPEIAVCFAFIIGVMTNPARMMGQIKDFTDENMPELRPSLLRRDVVALHDYALK